MGLPGGEALVEQMVGEVGVLGEECLGEDEGFGRLRAGRAVGVEGFAYDQRCDLVLPDEAAYGLEVGPERGAMDGEEWLRGEIEWVGDGEADPAIAYIQREGAARVHLGQCTRRNGDFRRECFS